jgi:hypothetical protein
MATDADDVLQDPQLEWRGTSERKPLPKKAVTAIIHQGPKRRPVPPPDPNAKVTVVRTLDPFFTKHKRK